MSNLKIIIFNHIGFLYTAVFDVYNYISIGANIFRSFAHVLKYISIYLPL